MKLDLMNWKNIERNAEALIEQGNVQIEVNKILRDQAKKAIKKLGGKTSEEEEQEAKRQTAGTS